MFFLRACPCIVLLPFAARVYANDVDVTVSYIRRDSNYADWGLYFWNAFTQNTWDDPLGYRIETGGFGEVATFVLRANEGTEINFIVHKGDEKASGADHKVMVKDGVHAWVIYGSSKTFQSEADAMNSQVDLTIRWVGIGREEANSPHYIGWGLHYWTTSGFSETSWKKSKPPDNITSIMNRKEIQSTAVFHVVGDADDLAGMCFIIHRGDFKLPNHDVCLGDNLGTREIWIGTLSATYSSLDDLLQAHAERKNQLESISMHIDKQDRTHALENGWSDNSAFIEIFVRSYKDADGDGWGDLEGLIGQLEYLKSLGIRGLWLMPIYPTGHHSHGYDVVDYRNVHPDYGTLDTFDRLVAAAHQQGIAIILDYVMNHASGAHPLFVDSLDIDSKYHDWFVWVQQDKPDEEAWTADAAFWEGEENPTFDPSNPCKWDAHGFKYPWREFQNDTWFYAIFDAGMPDWNLRKREVIEFHLDNLKFWLNRGVDGFRFDAAGHLVEGGPDRQFNQPENHVIMKETRELIESYGEAFTVCEAPQAPHGFASNNSCGRAFAFGYQDATVMSAIKQKVNKTFHEFVTSGVSDRMPLFLSNHDCFAGDRLWRQFGGDAAAYRLAAASYIFTSNTPFVYYGEEVGLAQNQEKGDSSLRSPMSWTGEGATAGFTLKTLLPNGMALSTNAVTHNVQDEEKDPASLLTWYKQLLHARSKCNVFGGKSVVQSKPLEPVLSLTRTVGEKVGVIVINYANESVEVTVATGASKAKFVPLLRSFISPTAAQNFPATSDSEGQIKLKVEGLSAVFHSHGCGDESDEDGSNPLVFVAIILSIVLFVCVAIFIDVLRSKRRNARPNGLLSDDRTQSSVELA